MQVYPFPNCCGLQILAEFPLESDFHWSTEEASRKRACEQYADQFKRTFSNMSKKLQTIVVLNDKQAKYFEPLLFEAGFKKLSQSYNPNTGNQVIVYSFILEEQTKKAERVF